MNDEELRLYAELKSKVQGRMDPEQSYSDDAIRKLIFETVRQGHAQLDMKLRREIEERIFNAIRHYDILTELIDNDEITDIMVNGPKSIFYELNGRIHRLEEHFESKQRLEELIRGIVGEQNRSINELSPVADARLKGGERICAVVEPACTNGPALTIRKFRSKKISGAELVEMGSLTQEACAFLEDAVRRRYNIFVCGGTSSGKTTFLNALTDFIPKNERIITIEDTAELKITGPENVVALEAGHLAEGEMNISVRDLVKAALRLRPDRIILGEIRGGEALDMLQAMNTGHEGSISTGHANSCRDMLSRIETMSLSADSGLPVAALRAQICSALDLLVFLKRGSAGTRVVSEIVQLTGIKNGEIETEVLFETIDGTLKRTGCALFRKKELSYAVASD